MQVQTFGRYRYVSAGTALVAEELIHFSHVKKRFANAKCFWIHESFSSQISWQDQSQLVIATSLITFVMCAKGQCKLVSMNAVSEDDRSPCAFRTTDAKSDALPNPIRQIQPFKTLAKVSFRYNLRAQRLLRVRRTQWGEEPAVLA